MSISKNEQSSASCLWDLFPLSDGSEMSRLILTLSCFNLSRTVNKFVFIADFSSQHLCDESWV